MRYLKRIRRTPRILAPRPLTLEPLDPRVVPAVVSVRTDYSGAPDSTLVVTVDLSNAGDAKNTVYNAVDVDLTFDPAVLSPVLVSAVPSVRAGTATPAFQVGGNVIGGSLLRLGGFAANDQNQAPGFTGTLFEVDFKVAAGAALGATSALNVTTATLVASDGVTEVVLSPAPTAGADPGVDGKFTVQDNLPLGAVDDKQLVQQAVLTSIDVLANDTGAGRALVAGGVSAPTQGGTAVINGTKIDYTSKAGFAGTDTFTYQITNGSETKTATVTVTVNAPPTAAPDTATAQQNGPAITIAPLANDSFAPDTGETLTVTAATVTSKATVLFVADKITYTPAAGFFGTDKISYTISDGRGGTAQSTVTVNVNATPVAADDKATAGRNSTGTVISVLANDTDADGPVADLTIGLVAPGTAKGGAVVVAGGQVKYTPAVGFVGDDTFQYTVTDKAGGVSGKATVTVTVTNAAPVAVNDKVSFLPDTANNVIDVLINDADPDASPGEVLTIAAVGATDKGGTVAIDGSKLKYTPAAGFIGTETFTYDVTDANGAKATATVTVSVAPNIPPLTAPDKVTVDRAATPTAVIVDVLANDSDPDGGAGAVLTIGLPSATSGQGGVLTVVNGKVSYTPAKGFIGTDTFAYTATDAKGGTSNETVTVTVNNVLPVAAPDPVVAQQNSTGNVFDLLANDTDPDVTGGPLTLVSVAAGDKGGTVVVDAGKAKYTPDTGFFGTETFTYVVADADGGKSTGTVTVSVNAAPIAKADTSTVTRGAGPVVIDVRGNDVDPDGATADLTVSLPNAATDKGGKVVLSGTKVSYTPAAGFIGTDTFTYVVTDKAGGTATATATVTVTNALPVPGADTFALPPGPATLDVLANDTDPDGPASDLTLVSVAAGDKGGTVAIVNGKVSYSPAAGFFGTETFTYVVADKDGGKATGTVGVTVNAPPVANNDAVTVVRGTGSTVIDVRANDTDPDGPATDLVVTLPSAATAKGGAVAVSGGKVTYTPAAGFIGVDTFTYTVTDKFGATSVATVAVTVTNAAPVAGADSATVVQGAGAAIINVLANDFDRDGTVLTLTAVSKGSAGGTAVIAGGKVAYTPADGFTGTETFTYTVTDADGATATGTVTVRVTAAGSIDPELLLGSTRFTVGADVGGPPTIRTFDGNGNEISSQTVFDPSFTGGVRTATADMNGDGVPDVIVGTGPGIATQVRVLDGVTGKELFSVSPFEASFTGGVFVAVGDIDGDGTPELIVTPDQGGGPRVLVFSADGKELASFFGIDDPAFRGGARAALGDINGDGKADLVVSAGFLGGPRIAVYDGASLTTGTRRTLVSDFFAFEEGLRNGAFVAVGDVNGDGKADLIFGAGPGGAPRVRVIDSAALVAHGPFRTLDDVPEAELASFFAGDDKKRGGVRVTVKDLDGDRFADVVTGDGVGDGDTVISYPGSGLAVGSTAGAEELDAFVDFSGGVFVG